MKDRYFLFVTQEVCKTTFASILFTTKSPGVPGTHLIDLGRMKKAELTWKPTGGFERDPWVENPVP